MSTDAPSDSRGQVVSGSQPRRDLHERESWWRPTWELCRREWRLSQLGVIAARVVVVVVGALVVKNVADNVGRTAAWAATSVFAVAVLLVFHRVVPSGGKKDWAYLAYLVTALTGVGLFAWKGLATDIGMSSPVAWYAALCLFFTGLTGLTKRLRSGPHAIARGASSVLVGIALAWLGLWTFERDADLRVFLVALVCTYGGLTVLAGGLLEREESPHDGAFPIGTWLDERPLWCRAALMALLTAVMVGFGVALVWAHGLDIGVVFLGIAIVVLGMFLIVSANVSDTAALLSVSLLVLSLSADAEPIESSARATAPVALGDTTLIALGDSFISGEGAESFYLGTNVRGENECRRAPTAYPPLLLDDSVSIPNDPFDSLIFLACSGAKARDLYYLPQHPDEPLGGGPQPRANGVWTRGATQLEQLDQRLRTDRPQRGLVLISLGGNDAGFSKIIMTCIGLGNCASVVDTWTDELADIKPGLRAAFRDLRGLIGPAVPVLVVPYPVPLARTRCDESVLIADEHARMYEFVVRLNDTVASVAGEPDIGFTVLGRVDGDDSSFQRSFEGRRVCDDGPDEPAVNYVGVNPIAGAVRDSANPRNWLHNSFHPNEVGHAIIAGLVRDWINDHPDRSSWTFEIPADRYHPRPDLERIMRLEEQEVAQVETAKGGDGCPVKGAEWEGRWAACENGRAALRALPWAVLFLSAAFGFSLVTIALLRPSRAGPSSATTNHVG